MKKNIIIFLSMAIIIFAISLVLIFFFVLYPLKYKNIVKKYAMQYELETSFVMSIINVESGFDKNAKSSAGAIGLMQLMPSTAKEIADKLNENFSDEMLFTVETNIKYGCYYLKYLMNMFNNNVNNVTASYNAGFNNVKEWLNNENYAKNGTIITTPIKETSNYIKKVNNALKIYKIIC